MRDKAFEQSRKELEVPESSQYERWPPAEVKKKNISVIKRIDCFIAFEDLVSTHLDCFPEVEDS